MILLHGGDPLRHGDLEAWCRWARGNPRAWVEVEAPAHAHLHHRDVHPRPREGTPRDEREALEEAQRREHAPRPLVAHPQDLVAERRVVDGRVVDHHALGHAVEVRRGEATDAIPLRHKGFVHKGGDAPLAVGARDVHAGHREVGVARGAQGFAHGAEVEVHPAGEQGREELGGAHSVSRRRRRATVARISPRGTTASTMPCSSRNSLR